MFQVECILRTGKGDGRYLRRHVFWCPTHSLAYAPRYFVLGIAKVTNLDNGPLAVPVQQNIVKLNVPIRYIQTVTEIKADDKLLEKPPRLRL